MPEQEIDRYQTNLDACNFALDYIEKYRRSYKKLDDLLASFLLIQMASKLTLEQRVAVLIVDEMTDEKYMSRALEKYLNRTPACILLGNYIQQHADNSDCLCASKRFCFNCNIRQKDSNIYDYYETVMFRAVKQPEDFYFKSKVVNKWLEAMRELNWC